MEMTQPTTQTDDSLAPPDLLSKSRAGVLSESPITDKTRALLEIQNQLQDVTKEVQAIRKMLQTNESWRAAAWRALTQFIGDLKNGK